MRYMNRKALMALGILISIANTDAMNRSTLDSYSMLIVAKHLKSEQDYKRLMQVCKKFKNTCKKFRYNPISITDKTKIFPNMQTHVLYDDDEEISDDFDRISHTKSITMSDRVKDFRDNHHYKNIVLDRKYVLQPIFVEKNGVVIIDGARQPTGLERSIFDPVITKLVIGNDTVNPAYSDGDNIREIGNETFFGIHNIKTIEVKPSIRKISSTAFGHNNVENLILHDGLVEISGLGLSHCTNLTQLILPNSLTKIKDLSIYGCTNLKNIQLSSSLTQIYPGLCKNMTELTKVTIPDGIMHIGSLVFDGCQKLIEISLPSTINFIGAQAFNMCSSLEQISFRSNLDFMPTSISRCNNLRRLITPDGWRVYVYELQYEDKVLLSDGTRLQAIGVVDKHALDELNVINDGIYPCRRLNNQEDVLDILEGIQEIDKYTFSKCMMLKNIAIPESVTKIGYSSFENCSNLKSIVLKGNIENIEKSSFEWCSNLSSIEISSSVTKLDMMAFYYCNNLIEIILPPNLQKIGSLCFGMNYNLKEIYIPNTVSEIDSGAFNSCTNLTYIKLPNNVSCISDFLFYKCSQLQSIEIPLSVRYIDFGTFFGCDNLSKIVLLKRRGEGTFRINNMFQTTMEFSDLMRGLVEIKEIDMPDNE